MFKVPDVTGDRVRRVAERAATDLARHKITQRLDYGLYRSWRCQEPGTWVHGFDVNTGPGWLMVTGDMGTFMWERTADMIGWAKGSIESLSYFAEKVPREFKIKEYDPEKAKAWLLGEVIEFWCDHAGCDMDDDDWNDWRNMLELYRDGDPTEQLDWERDVMEARIADGGDWPDFYSYTYHFLWVREGLRWFFANMDKAAYARSYSLSWMISASAAATKLSV
jgi:hypothetical protein